MGHSNSSVALILPWCASRTNYLYSVMKRRGFFFSLYGLAMALQFSPHVGAFRAAGDCRRFTRIHIHQQQQLCFAQQQQSLNPLQHNTLMTALMGMMWEAREPQAHRGWPNGMHLQHCNDIARCDGLPHTAACSQSCWRHSQRCWISHHNYVIGEECSSQPIPTATLHRVCEFCCILRSHKIPQVQQAAAGFVIFALYIIYYVRRMFQIS